MKKRMRLPCINHPYRSNALDLLLSYKVELEARQTTEPEERALIMQLSPLLLERISASELKGHQELLLRLLRKKIGGLSIELETQVRNLSLVQTETLGEALLDFTQASDLFQWLSDNPIKSTELG